MIGLGALLLACAPPTPPPPPGMVVIPAGSFSMGHAHGERADTMPVHEVRISAFYLDETLVTVAAFRAWVEATGEKTSAEKLGYGMTAVEGMGDWQWRQLSGASWRQPWGPEVPVNDDDPVVMVSWFDADRYCAARGARLPTEAEWEYAMRAGSADRFPWGPSVERSPGQPGLNVWQGDHEQNALLDPWRYVSPVRAFSPNAWGLYDPVGNVWQWVADWYDPDTYARDGDGAQDPRGPATGTHKVGRGGSWWCSQTTCDGFGLWYRAKALPGAPFSNNGFRCARDR